MAKKDPILDSFGLSSEYQPKGDLVPTELVLEPIATDNRQNVLRDFELAREHILENLKIVQSNIAELSDLCTQAQSDKYYSALASLLRTAKELTESLLDIQGKIREIELLQRNEPKKITNQLILTTSDLHKLLTQKKEDDE
jgi:hypothetical protein